jgi:hypothetical protein
MSKVAAWGITIAASIFAGAMFLPIAAIAGGGAWAISGIVLPVLVSITIWKRTPTMLDSGAFLIPASVVFSLLGIAVSFLFFCNVNVGDLCGK